MVWGKIIAKRELNMFLTVELHMFSGMVIGALAVMDAKKMWKLRQMRKQADVSANDEF